MYFVPRVIVSVLLSFHEFAAIIEILKRGIVPFFQLGHAGIKENFPHNYVKLTVKD